MKMALLSTITSILLFTCVSNSADAHQIHATHDVRPQEYMALSQRQLNASGIPEYVTLHGPTNDPLSTATGGPSGGLPDSN